MGGTLPGAARPAAVPHQRRRASAAPHTRPRRLWILLGGTVAVAILVFLGGQLALCGARRVARSKAYQRSLRRVRAMRSLSGRRRGADGPDGAASSKGGAAAAASNGRLAGGSSNLGADSAAAADPEQALSAAVADMAAQLQLRS